MRNLIKDGRCFYVPIRFSEAPRYYRDENWAKPGVVMVTVSPMDEHGYFSFGPSASYMSAACEKARNIVVEVNSHMPRCHGGHDAFIHISQIDMIVEHDAPIAELPTAPATDIDKIVAKLIVEDIPNRACLQLGIGGMPSAVGTLLVETDLKDLSVHSEMYVDSFTDLSIAGKITGAYKNIDKGRQTYAFGAGTKKTYDFMNDNPEMMSCSVDYVNSSRVLSQIDNLISINNTIEVDLFGQVCSESAGYRHISGSGGQQDFVLGAYLSKGGKSFICCSSAAQTKNGGAVSRIVPTLQSGGIVTATRTNIHWLVTEYGKVNLKGLSSWEIAEKIISIAHPDFRDDLVLQAEKMNIWRRVNKKRP